jgi:hypothetical protein
MLNTIILPERWKIVELQNIKKLATVIIGLAIIIGIVLGSIFVVQNFFLDWKMLDVMYINKAGVSWWATFTINGFLFTVGLPAAAIITLAGPFHESKVLNLLWINRRMEQRRPSLPIVAVYKVLLFISSYLVLTFIFAENMRMLALLMQAAVSGVGSWGEIYHAITLIFTPMAPIETVAALVATIEVEYTIFLIFMSLLLLVIGIRVVLDLIHYFARIGSSTRYPEVRVLASLSFLAVLGLFWMLLTVPYLEVDVGTQFFVFHLLILFIFSCVLTGISFGLTVFGRYGRGGEVPRMNQRFIAGLGIVTIALIVGPGLYTGYLVSGPIQGQLWKEWHWDPLMSKELNFTNWAGGLDIEEVPYMSLVNDTGVSDGHVLGHARLWDLTASRNKMRAQTIANWMALADSDIVYMNGREYWIAPYSLAPPSQDDFHKSYILYTHAEGATALDASSTTGEFLTPSQFQSVFGVNANFPIYYGESPPSQYIDGYEDFVIVDTTIAPETGTYNWEGEPDYILTGAELGLKKLAWSFADLSFAWLSYGDPEANVLMYRNIQERVQAILLPFLYTDYDPYLVFDQINHEVYYCVPIFSAYPLQLQYAKAPYLRLLGFSIINCADGTITWIRNPNANPAQFFIETMYESWYPWVDPPSWLLEQLRYPEELIDLQLGIDFYYHVNEAWVWRSESDFFEKPDSQPDIHYVLYPINGSLSWVGYQAVRYIRHEAQKMAGFYLFHNGPKVGTALFARAGTLDPITQSPLTPVFGVDAAIESFMQYARSDLVLIEPYRIGNRLLMPLSGMLVYLFPVYAEQESGEQLVETLKYVGIVDAEDINNVAYATTVAEAYSQFFYGFNETVTGVDFIDTNIDPYDIQVGEEAELSYIVKNGNSTSCNVTLQLGIHSTNFDVEYHGVNVTPIFDSGVYLYNVGMSQMYPNDVMGGSITLLAKSLDPGIYLATFIIELKILVNGNPTETEYFYLTVRST